MDPGNGALYPMIIMRWRNRHICVEGLNRKPAQRCGCRQALSESADMVKAADPDSTGQLIPERQ